MARKGLGKGLDSLIPDFYNEDFDSNSPQSLEDMLKESEEVEKQTEEEKPSEIEEVVIEEDEAEENDQEIVETSDEEAGGQEVHSTVQEEGVVQDNSTSEDLSSDKSSENIAQTPQEIQIQKKHVEEVKAIVDKNPRITLWSSRSSAVFRYLRKTEPEFSISKEASILIDEAVSKKYPEIWKLFEE